MVKKSARRFVYAIVVALIVLFAIIMLSESVFIGVDAESFSFYSRTAPPTFYGATDIYMDKNVVESFDPDDSRFRIMAKDFEDGDVTSDIVVESSDVIPTVSGEYSVAYAVTDSDGNTARITVPVHVLDKEDGECRVVRTITTLPAMKNLSLAGTERCNNGDRQILGVFLPAGISAYVKVIDSDVDFQITYFTNSKNYNGFNTVKASSDEYQRISNPKYDTVDEDKKSLTATMPLITSPRLNEERIDVTYKLEIKFGPEVRALDYYHYGDNEEVFKEKWRESGNDYAVIDGEAALMVVPYGDIDNIGDVDGTIGSLDETLDYYLAVVDRMDAMLGLSLDPDDPLDQNFRIKYTMAADSSSSAGAYYAGSYIAVCSTSIRGFFCYGWGSLHEIAHGYQGYMGKGIGGGYDLYFNETGNNVLAHYVQTDKTLYRADHDWMGTKENREDEDNAGRLSGEYVFHNDEGTYTNCRDKLFFIVNLLDAFEGEKSYGKLFSYYRKFVSDRDLDRSKYTVTDIYAAFFADEYGADITMYLDAWQAPLSDVTRRELMKKDLAVYALTSDVLTEASLVKLTINEGLTLKHGLIKEDVLEKYSVQGDLTVDVESDDMSAIEGAVLSLFRDGEYVEKKEISGSTVSFTDLPVGEYEIRGPVAYSYSPDDKAIAYDYTRVIVKEGSNTASIRFSVGKQQPTDSPITIMLVSYYNTIAYSVTLSANAEGEPYKKGTAVYGSGNPGNHNDTWGAQPDVTFAKITYKDKDGNVKYVAEIKGRQDFNSIADKYIDLELDYGDIIEVYVAANPQWVKVSSVLTGADISAYASSFNTREYLVTEQGLKALYAEDFDEHAVLYEAERSYKIDKINSLIASLEDKGDIAKNDYADEKRELCALLISMSDIDRAAFDDRVSPLTEGVAPTFIKQSESVTVDVGADTDLKSLVTVPDDCIVTVKTDFNPDVPGTYVVNYIICDCEGNVTETSITVEVLDASSDSGSISGTSGVADDGEFPEWIGYLVTAAASFALGCIFTLIVDSVIRRKKK